MPGPRPKPTHLKLLAGNPGHRPLNRDEPEPNGGLGEPPASLAAGMKAETAARLQQVWREIIAESPSGLLKKLDTYVLEQYCRALLTYRNAAYKVDEAGEVIKVKTGARQFFFQKNPFLSIMQQQQAILNRLADQLGFSPAARTRVKVSGRKKGKSALGKLRELDI